MSNIHNPNTSVLKIVVQGKDAFATQQVLDYQLNHSTEQDISHISQLIGKRVLVPFGNKKMSGLVVDAGPKQTQRDIREIISVIDEPPICNHSWLDFLKAAARLMSVEYAQAVLAALPPQTELNSQRVLFLTNFGRSTMLIDPAEQNLVQQLQNKNNLSIASLIRKDPQITAVIKSLLQRGVVEEKLIEKFSSATKPKMEAYYSLANNEPDISSLAKRLQVKIATIISVLKIHGNLSKGELFQKLPQVAHSLSRAVELGIVKKKERPLMREAHKLDIAVDIPRPVLSEAQKLAFTKMQPFIGCQQFHSFLLHGVTGSGKTEVYMRLIERAKELELSSLILVPEIALTPQLVKRLRGRFGMQIAILHSQLTHGERIDQWRAIAQGERRIVIGARSAMFAPLHNLGLVIIDEEHDHSYKQDERLAYHGRELAKLRAQMSKALLLYGSATPDVTTYYEKHLSQPTSNILSLPNRIAGMHKPQVHIIDMRDEPRTFGQPTILSRALLQALRETLLAKQSAILFLNRRGFTPVIFCPQCGSTPKCKQCYVTLTYHLHEQKLICHYCGITQKRLSHCLTCGASGLIDLGTGTERLALELQTIFPESRIARMDRDTTRSSSSFSQIIDDLENGKTDILVGTQMVTKGIDIERVTLIGVVSADMSLWLPDFRAGERTFQLVTQVAGRSGRGKFPGNVYIQTFNPKHYAIQAACGENYQSFYQQEIAIREAANYPPFCDLMLLHINSEDASQLQKSLKKTQVIALFDLIANLLKAEQFGPIASPLEKLKGKFRWQVLYKHPKINEDHTFAELKNSLYQLKTLLQEDKVSVTWDLTPYNFM